MIFVTALSLQLGGEIKNQIDIWHNIASPEEAKTKALDSPNNQPLIYSGYRVAAFNVAYVPPDFLSQDKDLRKFMQEQSRQPTKEAGQEGEE